MAKSNPLKTFNDAFAKRKAGLQKAQDGAQTAFQNYAKQYPNSASDTLSSNAPVFDANAVQARALAGAMKKTYGDNPVPSANPKSHTTAKGYFDKEGQQDAAAIQKSARIPQQKEGGPRTSDPGYAGVKKSDPDYNKKIDAGKKAGYRVDQPGAYKANLTDTAQVTYMKPLKTNPTTGGFDKKKGGATKSKKK